MWRWFLFYYSLPFAYGVAIQIDRSLVRTFVFETISCPHTPYQRPFSAVLRWTLCLACSILPRVSGVYRSGVGNATRSFRALCVLGQAQSPPRKISLYHFPPCHANWWNTLVGCGCVFRLQKRACKKIFIKNRVIGTSYIVGSTNSTGRVFVRCNKNDPTDEKQFGWFGRSILQQHTEGRGR